MAQRFETFKLNKLSNKVPKEKKSRKDRKKEVLEAEASGVEATVEYKGKASKNLQWDNIPLKDKIKLTLEGKGKWSVNEDGTPMYSIYGTSPEGRSKAQEKLTKVTDTKIVKNQSGFAVSEAGAQAVAKKESIDKFKGIPIEHTGSKTIEDINNYFKNKFGKDFDTKNQQLWIGKKVYEVDALKIVEGGIKKNQQL